MIVFTECFNCAPICRISLESYHRHHDYPVHVLGTYADLEELGEIKEHKNNRLMMCTNEATINKFKTGHQGTSAIFATLCQTFKTKIAHFDSDVFFKKESLSEIINAFNEGYDIIGTRRCYGNNPGRVKGLGFYPDTISTYFMGMNLEKLPDYDEGYLAKMWQGAVHPLGWPVLDFADPVTHVMLNNGAKIKYLDWNKFGSQNEEGKKTNDYELNLHMDVGSHLIHMGGVGSGYSYFNNKSNPEKSYAEWALGRWALFAKVFYNEDIGYNEPTIYGPDNRWISGNYDEHILQLVKREIE